MSRKTSPAKTILSQNARNCLDIGRIASKASGALISDKLVVQRTDTITKQAEITVEAATMA
jgi:hypothetical protein